MIKEYYRLGRPVNALAGCLAVFVSAYVAGPASWVPVIMAAITVLLITVSTNAWNDYVDIDIDRVNKPDRPLPAGLISPRGALYFSITGTALSLLTAAFINQPAFLIALASNILLYLYSWRLKCTILWGNAVVAAITGLCFIFGGVAAGNIEPVLMLAATVFFAITGREILKTMADYKGDLQHNCRTISTAWGMRTARLFLNAFLIIACLAMLATFFIEQYSLVYLLLVIFCLYPLFIYVIFKVRNTASSEVLEQGSTIIKYGFFIWFLAVILGAGFAS